MNNNSILRVALETKFNKEDIENVLKVISNSDNVEIATEILLGIYKEPVFKQFAKLNEDARTNIEFLSYNPFKNRVNYTYNQIITEKRWFKKTEKVFIQENAVSRSHWSDDAAKELDMTEEEFTKLHSKEIIDANVSAMKSEGWASAPKWEETSYDKTVVEV